MKKNLLSIFIMISVVLFNGCRNADKKSVSKVSEEVKVFTEVEDIKTEEKIIQAEKSERPQEEIIVPKKIELASPVKEKDSDGDKIPDKVDTEPNKTLKDTLHAKGFQNLIILDNIKFNSDELSSSMLELLDVVSQILRENESIKIKVIGHTCDLGTEEYNLDLSKKRTDSAEKYLLSKGTNKKQITLEWKGEKEPLTANINEKSRSKNRRVQILFYEDVKRIK